MEETGAGTAVCQAGLWLLQRARQLSQPLLPSQERSEVMAPISAPMGFWLGSDLCPDGTKSGLFQPLLHIVLGVCIIHLNIQPYRKGKEQACELLRLFHVLCHNFPHHLSSKYLQPPSTENWEGLEMHCLADGRMPEMLLLGALAGAAVILLLTPLKTYQTNVLFLWKLAEAVEKATRQQWSCNFCLLFSLLQVDS